MSATRDPRGGAPVLQLSATAWGLVRGVELAGDCHVELGEAELVLRVDDGRHRVAIRYERVDGLRLTSDGESLTLFLAGGDELELGGTKLGPAAREIAHGAYRLPELMRPLRGLGSHRGRPGSEHDRFFGALLAARREVQRSDDPVRRLVLFDARTLRRAVEQTLAAFAAERFPRSAPDRRALETALLDLAQPLFAALEAVPAVADRARGGDDETRFARWREWTRAMHGAFDAADRVWLAVLPLLGEPDAAPRRGLLRRIFRRGAAVLLMAGTAAAPRALRAQAAGVHSTYEVSGVRAESLLAHGMDVVEVRGARVLVVADARQLELLRTLGTVERELRTPLVMRQQMRAQAKLPGDTGAGPVVYRPYDGAAHSIRQYVDSLVAAHPDVLHPDTLGTTYEGRPILAVKVGAAGDAADRPNVLFLATYHAREWAATEMALRLMRYLVDTHGARVDSLIASRDLWIVPVVNPDGYEYTFTTDRLWRKNRHVFANGVGVDLNRNHAEHWAYDDQGSSPSPGSEIYRGPGPASEVEVQAVQRFHALHPMVASVSYHTYSGLVIYPPGYRYGTLPGDLGVYRALAGTDADPVVRDHLPGSERTFYHSGPSWSLYPTNGDYNDWAYARDGTISFTPELTSGYEGSTYYGFEFPDDETKLRQLFSDNLPFALDVLESARDPLAYRSPTTGMRSERLMLESVAPAVRARVPAGATDARIVAEGSLLSAQVDSESHGTYTRRLVSQPFAHRPASVTLQAGVLARKYVVLAASGAEPDESGWSASGFAPTTLAAAAGSHAWSSGAATATLRSPVVPVPADMDTVSVLFWTRYSGDGFSLAPHGEVRVSLDGGTTWTLAARLSGTAEAFYTEQATVTGAAGRALQVEFRTDDGLPWSLDEIALVGHADPGASATVAAALQPSANPARGDRVTFTWPFATAGDLLVYDFGGRLVSRTTVAAGAIDATWEIAASGARSGVYVVVARAGSATRRVKLFVVRGGA